MNWFSACLVPPCEHADRRSTWCYWHANPFISPFVNRTVTPWRALSWVDVCSLCLCLEPLTCFTNYWAARSCLPKVPRQKPKSVRPWCRAHNVAAHLKSFKLTFRESSICHVFHGFCMFLIFVSMSWAGHVLGLLSSQKLFVVDISSPRGHVPPWRDFHANHMWCELDFGKLTFLDTIHSVTSVPWVL